MTPPPNDPVIDGMGDQNNVVIFTIIVICGGGALSGRLRLLHVPCVSNAPPPGGEACCGRLQLGTHGRVISSTNLAAFSANVELE